MNTNMKFAVTGQRIELTEPVMLVAGTVHIYTAAFVFDSAWEGYTKTAVFRGGDVEREQLLTDDACRVPWEVLLPGAYLKVGVYGTRDGSRLPTIWTERTQYINAGAGPTEEAAEPSPTLVEQLTAKVGNLDALKTEDKSSVVAAVNEIWASGGGGTGGGTTDHSKLTNRGAADQHPMSAITGLEKALEGKQPTGSYLTDKDLDATLKESGKAADAKAVGDALSTLSEEIVTTAESKVSAHNTGETSHSDIRLLISGLTDRINALADSDDTTLDQLSEIVAYIKSNRDLISAITTDKISVTDIVNDLVTNVANKPLSAAQGVALKALIDAISVPDKLPNPNALTFSGAASGSYDGSTPLNVEIPSGGGGSGENWRLVNTVTTTEDVSNIIITQDSDGNPLSLKKVKVFSKVRGNSAGLSAWCRLTVNNLTNYFTSDLQNTFKATAGQDYYNKSRVDISIYAGRLMLDLRLASLNNAASKNTLFYINNNGCFENYPDAVDAITSIRMWSSSAGIGAGTEIQIYGVDA